MSVSTTSTLGKLNGKLPPVCQDTLDMLLTYMKGFDVSKAAPVTPVKEIKTVILTGATGFVGRHFIPLLLDCAEPKIDTIYCPIRADNDVKAMERLVKAMNDANQWDESYRSKIRAFAGDMNDDNFGASEALYEELAQADCIYHFAASLNLAAPFDEMRQANSVTMRPVIKVVLTQKKKHLFLGSTVGMFPQYFCMFANDMADKPIERNAMPDVRMMKLMFPLFVSGYVWTKLINELLCYEMMRTKSIPLAVLRMPNMYANMKSGMMTPDDPYVSLLQAVMQLRMYPGKQRPFLLEDSHTCNKMMLNISLNPNRKNVIFHCSRQSGMQPSELPGLELIGYPMKYVSYETFKEKCIEMGEKSPLHGYWVLIDHYSSYWVRQKKSADPYPIDISTVEEDCVPLPPRPNGLEVFGNNAKWALSHPELWKYDPEVFRCKLDLNSLLTPAKMLCEKYNVDLDAVLPKYALEGLTKICDEVDPPINAGPHMGFYIISRLETRIHFYNLLKMHPEIEKEQIASPIFILGLNRTGTTFLHRLLMESGMFAAPYLEDQAVFLPAEKISKGDEEASNARLEFIEDTIRSFTESFEGIHDTGLGVPEEDMFAHGHSFLSLEYDVQFDLPKYREWIDEHPLTEVYAEHKKWLQYLTWSRRRAGKPVPRWCLKLPWHARSLEALLKMYPDAVLVHNHRDVKDVAGSWFSLVESQRLRVLGSVDRAEMAQGQVKSLGKTLASAMQYRAQHPENQDKWLDIKFTSLIDSPIDVAKQVIKHSGGEPTAEATAAMEKFVADSVAARSNVDKKLHSYSLAEYNVDPKVFEEGVFAQYKKQHP